jgi:hypothetical protein
MTNSHSRALLDEPAQQCAGSSFAAVTLLRRWFWWRADPLTRLMENVWPAGPLSRATISAPFGDGPVTLRNLNVGQNIVEESTGD